MKDNVIIVFGDSIAWGSADTVHGGWVELLKNFAAKKTGFCTAVYNLGISGDSIGSVIKRIVPEAEVRRRHAKMKIILAVGTNEARYIKTEGNLEMPAEKFRESVYELIKAAKGLTNDVVYLGPTPCDEARTMPISWVPDLYHTLKLTKRNNDIIREECKKSGVPFIDLFSEWSKLDYAKLLDDGIHPTTEGHKKIFKTVSAFLLKNKLL